MQLTKKQAKQLLDIMSIGKKEHRPVISNAVTDTYKGERVLVATDGYRLAALAISEEVPEGKLLSYDALDRWCKLATAKSRLASEELLELLEDEVDHYDTKSYPKWQGLAENLPEAQDTLYINAEYLLTMQTLAGKPLEYTQSQVKFTATDEGNLYIVMGLRKD